LTRSAGKGGGVELPSGTVTFLFTDIEGSTRRVVLLAKLVEVLVVDGSTQFSPSPAS
jgi:class 3 adenylate cyclase